MICVCKFINGFSRLLILVFLFPSASLAKNISEDVLVELLSELKPLQKVHYSWHIPNELLDNKNDPRLYEYARLTRAISLRAETLNQKQMDNAVQICESINKIKKGIECTLALNYSPWHRKFGKDLPATDFGESYVKELKYYSKRLEYSKKALDRANAKYKSNIKISALLLDSERFHVVKRTSGLNTTVTKRHGVIVNVDKWNAAITRKHTDIYEISKTVFPDARIEQYERGGWMPAATKSGWMRAQWYALDEPGDSYSLSLYRIVELSGTREAFRRTVLSAEKSGVYEVTPYVALGSGNRRKTNKFHNWEPWDYDLIYSWQLGAELNNKWYGDRPARFAPWNAAKVVVFFPSPFARKYPAWSKHFIAYVRGANKLQNISDLE